MIDDGTQPLTKEQEQFADRLAQVFAEEIVRTAFTIADKIAAKAIADAEKLGDLSNHLALRICSTSINKAESEEACTH